MTTRTFIVAAIANIPCAALVGVSSYLTIMESAWWVIGIICAPLIGVRYEIRNPRPETNND